MRSGCAIAWKVVCKSSGFLCSFCAGALMRSRPGDKFDTGDSLARVTRTQPISFMRIIKRIGVILIWFAGVAVRLRRSRTRTIPI